MKRITILIAFLLAGCASLRTLPTNGTAPLSQILFVEYWTETHGKWLDDAHFPGMRIDFPTYGFNEDSRVLTDYSLPGIDTNRPWVLLLGTGESLHGNAGGGAASGLHPVSVLPCTTNGITLLCADTGGTVALRCWGSDHILAPGETVTQETDRIRTNTFGDRPFRIRLTDKERITNFGLIERTNVVRYVATPENRH